MDIMNIDMLDSINNSEEEKAVDKIIDTTDREKKDDMDINESDEKIGAVDIQKVIGLTDREYRMLEVIDKERVIRAVDLAWQAGYTDYSYCRKCLGKLEKYGYVSTVRDMFGNKCYCLTGRGLAEIGKPRAHTYEMSFTTNHELTVARVATCLCIMHWVSVFDMMFDPQMKTVFPRGDHRPDILLNDIAYEIELNHKRQEQLEKNIRSNEQFNQQIWIVPKNRQKIAHNLEKAAKAVAANITVLWLDDLETVIADANIHDNKLCERGYDQKKTAPVSAKHTILDKYNLLTRKGEP